MLFPITCLCFGYLCNKLSNLSLVVPNTANLNNTTQTSDVQLADLNSDGSLDLLATYNSESLLAIWLGQGDGTFLFPSTYRTGPNPQSLATTDLNGDGLVDVTVSHYDDSTVGFYQNIGGGIMSQLPMNLSTGASTHPRKIVAADVNKDGLLNYITANYGGGGVSVILSRYNFTYTSMQGSNTLNFNPVSLTVAYFTKDAHLDLDVANHEGVGTTGFAFVAGFGNGPFAAPIFNNTSGNMQEVAAGDFNSDGDVDAALVNNREDSLAILFSSRLGVVSNLTLYQSPSAFINLVVCDANRDGLLDICVAVRASGLSTCSSVSISSF